jgi:hypothetical protein
MMTDTSILLPSAIATLANENSLHELKLLLKSIEIWNEDLPPVYLFCTSSMLPQLEKIYKGKLYINPVLDAYSLKTRFQMEKSRSLKGMPNLFYDFTQEKCDLMQWALESLPRVDREGGVLFCDADIVWLAPLPPISTEKKLGLSRHFIRQSDEEKFGTYNAGFLWTNSLDVIKTWKEACFTSRFFEQAALEDVEKSLKPEEVLKFGENVNYGWWRMFQNMNTPSEQQGCWSILRDRDQIHSGILVKKRTLLCIHTHFKTTDTVTLAFNSFVLEKLNLLKSQRKVTMLLHEIKKIYD